MTSVTYPVNTVLSYLLLTRYFLKNILYRRIASSIFESPLKIPRLLEQLLAARNLISKSAEANHDEVKILKVKGKCGAFSEDKNFHLM